MINIYIFRIHYWDNFIEYQWNNLKNIFGYEYCFILFDITNFNINNFLLNDNHIFFIHFNDLKNINKLHYSNIEQIESQLVYLLQNISIDFDFMWIIEYDVFCKNWNILKINDEYHYDFLATYIENYSKNNKRWSHWRKIIFDDILLENRVKCFFPITRFSKKLLIKLFQEIGNNSGYCELYIPTFVKKYNFTIHNLFNDSYWNHNQFIFTTNNKTGININECDFNKIYHPIVKIINN